MKNFSHNDKGLLFATISWENEKIFFLKLNSRTAATNGVHDPMVYIFTGDGHLKNSFLAYSKSFQGEVIDDVVEYIKKNVPNKRIDYRTYGISIIAFLYALNLDKYHGRTASFNDEEKTIENFIDILYCMINH